MAVDWGDLNDAVLETFGTGDPVTCKPRDRASFSIASAIVDDNHKRVAFDGDVEVSTTGPALFVKREDLPEGFRFDEEDRIEVGAAVYKVLDEQPDSVGGLIVLLIKVRGR